LPPLAGLSFGNPLLFELCASSGTSAVEWPQARLISSMVRPFVSETARSANASAGPRASTRLRNVIVTSVHAPHRKSVAIGIALPRTNSYDARNGPSG
jgi:hypothetical protein